MLNLPSPLAVVCHDAGGANLIMSWLETWQGQCQAYMLGPAAKLWMKRFPDRGISKDLTSALHGAKALLSGTGWETDLEHSARVEAAKRGIYSIGVLDHWVNYLARFERNEFVQWPDEIWVVDIEAEVLARSIIPSVPIYRKFNSYLEEQLSRIGPPPGNNSILYVLEPVRNNWGREKLGEFQALDYALSKLQLLARGSNLTLNLRPHPSETYEKYQSYLAHRQFIRFDTTSDLATAISENDVVLGVESYALTVALAAGRPVFSTLPPWAPELRLPHTGIVEIRKHYNL